MHFLGGLIDRAFAVAGALLFVQFPIFVQQYMQQLVGRVDELKLQVESLRKAAALSRKTLEQYIQKFLENGDSDFVMQGQFMESIVERCGRLSDALHSLQNCTLIEKPFFFFASYSHEIAVSTFNTFKSGLLFTIEGGVYALAGTLAGYAVYKLCAYFFYFLKLSSSKRRST